MFKLYKIIIDGALLLEFKQGAERILVICWAKRDSRASSIPVQDVRKPFLDIHWYQHNIGPSM